MTAKLILLGVLAFFAGVAFITTGIYFLSQGFLDKLNASNFPSAFPSEMTQHSKDYANSSPGEPGIAQGTINLKKNEFRAKGSGLTAISLGTITIVWGIMLFSFPQIASALALVYMIFLIAAFAVITLIFK